MVNNGSSIVVEDLCVDYPLPSHFFSRRKNQNRDRVIKRKFRALRNINFEVEGGEKIGLVGLNGAGKTTLFRALSGILYPSFGEVKIGNIDATSPSRLPVGYLAASPLLYRRITGYENLRFVAKLFHVQDFEERIHSLAELVGLEDVLHDYVEQYSTGMRSRLDFARALLPSPSVLLLDEPFSSFDVQFTKKAKEYIDESNITVFLATHNVLDIEELTNRLILLHKGELKRDVSFEDLSEVAPTHEKDKVLSITEFVSSLLESSASAHKQKYEPIHRKQILPV